jgi:proteasome lid subunit RPN8/RPN11
MMLIAPDALRQVVEASEAAYPGECCGLLVGRQAPNGVFEVVRAHPSANLGRQTNRFEIDPRLWVDLARALGKGPTKVVGLYHSHPDGPAQPSAVDLQAAWGEELVWVVVSVAKGEAIQVTAHILDHGGQQFRELPLRTTDWTPYPVRPDPDKPPDEAS